MPELQPKAVSFEQAIALSQDLLAQIEQGCNEAEIASAIGALVQTENGARGFFVSYLTDPRSLADHPTPGIIQGLQSAPDLVSDLLVKNLAMSSAMAVTHRRNGDEELAEGSDRVRSRTSNLIQLLQLPHVVDRAQKLHESATTGLGEYSAFLDRWGYDAEQKQVIGQAIDGVMNQTNDESLA